MRRVLAGISWPLLSLSLLGCGVPYLELEGDDAVRFDVTPEEQVEFGLASPYGSPVTQEAWLRSRGAGSVAVESIDLGQDARGSFTVAFDPTPCVLSGDDELPVEFRFHPDETGQYSGRVTFLAVVNGNELELTRRLMGSGCTDVDGDGQCAGSAQPGWEPLGPEDDSGLW